MAAAYGGGAAGYGGGYAQSPTDAVGADRRMHPPSRSTPY